MNRPARNSRTRPPRPVPLRPKLKCTSRKVRGDNVEITIELHIVAFCSPEKRTRREYDAERLNY